MPPYPKALAARPRLRQSLLANFDACALSTKFDLDYAYLPPDFPHVAIPDHRNHIDWSTHPQGRGQLTHRTLARCLEEMARHGEDRIEVDVALAILMEVLRQAEVPVEDVVAVPMEQVEDIYWIVKKWAYDNTFDVAKLIDVEKRLESKVHYPDPEGGKVERVVSGQLDALFSGESVEQAICLDWKDTWKLPAPTEVSFEGYFQQRWYSLLVMDNYPSIQEVVLREFYVRYSETREAVINREALDDIRDEVAALAERFDRALETDTWKPTPGVQCNWCLRPSACPIFPTARGVGRIGSEQEAEKVAAQLVVAQAVVKQHMAAVREWADRHGGSVPIRDEKGPRVYGYRESFRTEKPKPEEVTRYLMEHGQNVDTEQVIEALYPTKKGTRFEAHVPKPKLDVEDEGLVEKLQASAAEGMARKWGDEPPF